MWQADAATERLTMPHFSFGAVSTSKSSTCGVVTLTDQVLIELCPAVERAHPWLDVSCREHPDVPRGKPKATARVDLIPGLAVFFSVRWKKWTSTAVVFKP